MDEFPVTASVDQWNALLELIDSAVKTRGLEVALAAGWWDKQIKDSANAAAEMAKAQAEAEKSMKEEVPPAPSKALDVTN